MNDNMRFEMTKTTLKLNNEAVRLAQSSVYELQVLKQANTLHKCNKNIKRKKICNF